MSTNATSLLEDGYVVLQLYNHDELQYMKERFVRTLRSLPEYNADTGGGMQYSKTGFGALGVASSFHNAFVRAVRLRAYSEAEPLLREYDMLDPQGVSCRGTSWSGFESAETGTDGHRKHPRMLHEIVDRMLVRDRGQMAGSEPVHQDVSPCFPGDTVFGGWVAFTPQRARLVPGSHRHFEADAKGFARIDNRPGPDGKRPFTTEEVEIPAGCMLIMHQTIVHEVAGKTNRGEPILRLFTGWRLTHDSETLLEKVTKMGAAARIHGNGAAQQLNRVLDDMAVPKIPSNQMPYTYNVRNIDSDDQRPGLRAWFDRYIDPNLLTEREVYAGGGTKLARDDAAKERPPPGSLKMDRMMARFAPPVAEMLEMTHPPSRMQAWYEDLQPYSDIERFILTPHHAPGGGFMGALFDRIRDLLPDKP